VKKIVSVIIICCMLIPTMLQINVLAYTDVKITYDGQVVDSFAGVDAIYATLGSYSNVDTNTTYSCAAFLKRFCSKLWGVTIYNINMVQAAPTVTKAGHSVSLKTVSTPRPGDIMQTKNYSHVAVVKSVSGSNVTLIEQNVSHNSGGYRYAHKDRVISVSSAYFYRMIIDGVEAEVPGVINPQYTDLGDNFYATINHVTNGHAIGIDKTGLLELVDKKVTEKNRWHFMRQNDGSYMIYLNVGSQVMDVQNAGTIDGTRVGLSNANYGTAQKWYICKKDNTYYFKTQSSNMVLDVGNNHGEIGDWIQMWTPNQSQAQYFTINNVVPFNEWIYIHNQSETPVLYSDEDVIFTYDAVTASYYDLWLYKDKQQVGQMYAGTSKTYSKRLSAGNYEVLFASQNNVGWNYGSFHPFVVIDRYYTIQFDANGGTCNQASKTVTHNTAYGALPTPTKNGYRFNGWYTEAGGGTKVTSDTIVTITANQTLYAQWVEDKYTLQVSPMGGTWNDFDTTQSYKLSYQETKELPVPYREGYTFASWELDFEGEGHEISGSGTSDFNQVRGIPLIKDPSFKESLGQFSLYNNTANGSVTHTRIEKEDGLQTGSSYMMKITSSGEAHPGLGGFRQITPSKANGIFYHVIIAKIPKGYYIQQANNDCGTGWNYEWLTSREGTGNWETYIYKFNCGASGTFSTLGHIFITSDKDMWWPDVYGETTNTPITWYVGYSEILDATNTNTASSLYTMGNGNASLYALWIPNTYTISFDTNGGNPLNETKTVVYDSKYNTLPLPQKTGFKFAGWFTEPDGGVEITSDTIVSIANSHKLYARWKSTEPHTSTTVNDRKFIIEPNNIERGSVIILALYKNQKFVKLYNATYEGEDIPFTVTEDYDEAKVMVWKDLNTLKPITDVEIVK